MIKKNLAKYNACIDKILEGLENNESDLDYI